MAARTYRPWVPCSTRDQAAPLSSPGRNVGTAAILVDPDPDRVHGPGDVVITPYGTLPLDELYAAVHAVATRQTD